MPDSDVRINVTFVKKSTGGSTGGDEKPTDPNKPTEPEKPTDPETPGENPGGSGNEDEQGNTGGQTSPLEQFTDLEPNGWYKTSLTWAISNGYMNGIGGTTRFEPNKAMTRAQMAAVLYNMAGSPSINTSIVNKFSDCTPSAWYAKAVAWAVREGIFSGLRPQRNHVWPQQRHHPRASCRGALALQGQPRRHRQHPWLPRRQRCQHLVAQRAFLGNW